MELLTTDGTLCAVKAACTVWSEGKPGDNIKRLPIAIRYRHPAVYGAVDMVLEGGCFLWQLNCAALMISRMTW